VPRRRALYSLLLMRAWWLVAGVLVLAATVRVVQGLIARREVPAHAPPRPPVVEATLDRPASYWSREGFVLMEGPVRPPTSEDGRERIVVYLKLPAAGVVKTRLVDMDPHHALEYPIGTIADRVEYWGDGSIDTPPQPGWRVADVRGTTLGADGEVFHVYRPTSASVETPLLGIAWPRGDDAAQEEATRALGELLENGHTVAPRSATARAHAVRSLRALNECAACHTPLRSPRTSLRAPSLVNRGTDASGFFQVSTVLSDRAPLETYRPSNPNAGDPFLRFACGSSDAPAIVDRGRLGKATCPGGEVPVGILDVRAALQANDPHALRLCASRRFLYEHLDANGKGIYHEAIAECEPGG
jgi:hypothetical protein